MTQNQKETETTQAISKIGFDDELIEYIRRSPEAMLSLANKARKIIVVEDRDRIFTYDLSRIELKKISSDWEVDGSRESKLFSCISLDFHLIPSEWHKSQNTVWHQHIVFPNFTVREDARFYDALVCIERHWKKGKISSSMIGKQPNVWTPEIWDWR